MFDDANGELDGSVYKTDRFERSVSEDTEIVILVRRHAGAVYPPYATQSDEIASDIATFLSDHLDDEIVTQFVENFAILTGRAAITEDETGGVSK